MGWFSTLNVLQLANVARVAPKKMSGTGTKKSKKAKVANESAALETLLGATPNNDLLEKWRFWTEKIECLSPLENLGTKILLDVC